MEIKLSTAHVAAFRDLSRDRNPLHTDADYSRRTQFGRPVVYGMAGVLAAISAWADGRCFEFTSIRARFERPLFADEVYSLQVVEKGGQARLQVLQGGQLNFRVIFNWREREENSPKNPPIEPLNQCGQLRGASGYGVPPSGGGASANAVISKTLIPLNHTIAPPAKAGTPYPEAQDSPSLVNRPAGHDEVQGKRKSLLPPLPANDWDPATGAPTVPNPFPYSIDGTAAEAFARVFNLRADQLPASQLRALLWSSYFVGMEFPGRQALFGEFDFAFDTITDVDEVFELRELATAYNPHYGTATISGRGTGIGSLRITAFYRPKPVRYSFADVREGLGTSDDFKDRAFFISGATRGFGEVISKALILHGGTVALNYRSETPETLALAGELGPISPASLVIKGDVSRAEDCRRMGDEVLARFGKLDYLVCNAFPHIGANSFAAQGADKLQDFVQRALGAATELLHTFLPRLGAGATVVYISSIYTVEPPPQFSHYVAAKSAAEGLLRVLAREFSALRFVIVRPPKMLTDQTNLAYDPQPAVSPVEISRRLMAALQNLGPESNLFELNL